MMPGLDGFEILEIIKNNPALAEIKIILLTAANRTEDKVRAFKLGAADYMVKPFSKGELLARLENAGAVEPGAKSSGGLGRKISHHD
jgi:DNA-binding response OmpR family regulator